MKAIGEVIREQNKLGKEIKRDFKIQTILIIILIILVLIICFYAIKLSVKYESLKIENKELNKVVKMQNSMISDLQEDNMKLQEMIK